MLVGAYRDNEVSSSHPLTRTLAAIRKAGARMQEIVLAPLGLDDVGRLVSDALHCEGDFGHPLAQLVQGKTGGNPFFAIQLITALAEEGLLAFDSVASVWQWNIDHIRAKSYTDNVVDLLAGQLKRFSAATQEALKQLACLGNVAEITALSLVHGTTEEAMHAALREAVHAGLVFRADRAYKFLHDRIQQAAYVLIPEDRRAEVHLRIGRALLASMTADELAEHLFDVANQLNRGAALLVDGDEKARVATIDLRAGRKAKASAAYASARAYFSAGMALLDERDWGSQYELTFSLWLERAECEYLSGDFDRAGQLIGELLQRGVSKVDQAAVYHVKVRLHTVKSENQQAVDSALASLRLFGIDLPAHPTWEQVQAEYEAVWRNLEGRSIESLIDLPLVTDPEMRAAMDLLSALHSPAYFTDFHLYCLLVCRMVNVSMQHGTSGPSAHAYGRLGTILGRVFHRYREGYRFAQLACDLVEKHGFIAYQAKVYTSMGIVALWTQPITTAIDFNRAALRTATERGDLTSACYGMFRSVSILLLRNDPLDAVWRESEKSLDFVRKARYRDVVDIIVSQQRFIENMRGRTARFSTFSDAHFDETAFEAQLTEDRMSTMVCWYWILKVQARVMSSDYEAAIAAASKAKALLWSSDARIQLLDFHYFSALAIAAVYETAPLDRQREWRDLLTAHREQLREWADNYPPTFGDKYALVSAEIARLEGRDADAMRLYEKAIQAARENGFVQNEGLAHEVAARFYSARGVDTIAHACLREARRCYLRWGAFGKVRQLEQLHPHLRDAPVPASPTTTIGAPVEHLDLTTVMRVSQAVSGEIVLETLIETLMRTALEHAGAQRGLLIVPHGGAQRVEAEATTSGGTITVRFRQASVSAAELPDSVLHYVLRTQESLILDDASAQNAFSADEYIRHNRVRSVLCLPLIKQATLIGVLYLENNLTPRVFTPARSAVLKLIASQAAISLENAYLYTDLQQENSERRRAEEALRRSEAYLAQAQTVSNTGSFGWNASSGAIYWSAETFRIFEFDPANPPELARIIQQTHPEDRAFLEQTLDRARHEKKDFDLEHRLLMRDGSIKHLQVVARALADESGALEFVGAVMDITRRKRAQETQRMQEREREELQRQLQQAAKMEAIGRLAGGIAHDFNNILGAILGYGEMAQKTLGEGNGVRRYVDQVMQAGARGKGLVERILAFSRSGLGERVPVHVQSVVEETLEILTASLASGVR